MSPKVDYGLFRAYALPQSCPTFAIRGAPPPLLAHAPPLLAHVGRAPSIILPLEQARCQNDTFGTIIIILKVRIFNNYQERLGVLDA